MKTRKRNKKGGRKVYTRKDFNSNDGMLTTVWGPSIWHFLHTMSFNYSLKPTSKDKLNYKNFVLKLGKILPCGHCRKNFPKNLKKVPLTETALKNRHNFSKWMYKLHEQVNKMLKKKSGLTYKQVRNRYENFRARCTEDLETKIVVIKHKKKRNNKTKIKKENGCTEPLFGKKSKCVIKIVPKDDKTPTFQMDEKCRMKRRTRKKT
ncbi:MAG: hypothetical protein CXT73_06700 [Methanobacteriota archaeon]|nr:MAG: hypothetical protein CXT73_06700 [Euryarchaeota archaeon]